LSAWAGERLTPYKRPGEIRLIEEMPIGPTGKIMKVRLKEMLTDGG
jgi:acyl-coenzyme A synthetase/AMP-(fatty) acid ligase